MGDHRADVKIMFTIHGKTYRMSSYINWYDDGTGVDHRVIDFFRESWEDAKARYQAEAAEFWAREHARDTERAERRELERLKLKYQEKSALLHEIKNKLFWMRMNYMMEEHRDTADNALATSLDELENMLAER